MSHERGGGAVGSDLVRGVLRGAITAALLALPARQLIPATSVFAIALLAVPLSLVERSAAQGRLRMPLLVAACAAWLPVFVAAYVLHFQSVYAIGVVGSRTLVGGFEALRLELAHLGACFGDEDLRITWAEIDGLALAAYAVVATGYALAPVREDATPLEQHPRFSAFAIFVILGAASATAVFAAVVGCRAFEAVLLAPFAGMLILGESILIAVALGLARVLADVATSIFVPPGRVADPVS